MAKQQMKFGKIKDLVFDDQNANEGTEEGNALISESIEVLKLGRSVLVDKNNRLIAGNKTTQNAIDQNYEDIIIVETTGEQLVVVKRMDLDLNDETDHRARGLALADNRTAAVNLKWNPENMKIHFDAVKALEMPSMVFDLKISDGGAAKEGKDHSDNIGKIFKIEIELEDEEQQEQAYNDLKEQGYQCKILTL